MPVSFDWDFPEESKKLRQSAQDKPPPRSGRHWLRRAAIVLFLLTLSGLPIAIWVHRRLKAVEKVEAELRVLIEMELKTIADGDVDLFRTRQNPIDIIWREKQVARYFTNVAEFVPAPGMRPSDRPPEIKQVHVFGYSGRAELIRYFDSVSYPSPLPFHATWFYRRNQDNVWYHVAPADDYWGASHGWRGVWLDIYATEAEADTINPVAPELTNLATQICQRLKCPEGIHYALSFLDSPGPHIEDDWWVLPALYLTGLPEGEEARAAWQEALRSWLFQTLVQSQIGEMDFSDRVIFRRLVNRLQAELGIAELSTLDAGLLTEAVHTGPPPPVWNLWHAKVDSRDPQRTRLLEAEVDALLALLERQVGAERLFELLPALGVYDRFNDALSDIFQLDPSNLTLAWFEYLSRLTSVYLILEPDEHTRQPFDGALELPPAPPPLPFPPGDDIVIGCQGRIWAGNADGSDLAPLTPRGYRFFGLNWSPDGKWLLTSWWPDASGLKGAPYLVASGGSEGRILTKDASARFSVLGWNPNGREVILYSPPLRVDGTGTVLPVISAMDIHLGSARQFPGAPVWSPSGEHLVYRASSVDEAQRGTWLAGADWENARRILEQDWDWTDEIWSPDGSKLALVHFNGDADDSSIAIYDLAADELSRAISGTDLTSAFLHAGGAFVTDGTDLARLQDTSLKRLRFLGWSADGQQLLVWAQTTDWDQLELGVLGAIPLSAFADTSSSSVTQSRFTVLALGEGKFVTSAAWSPTDPDRMILVWLDPDQTLDQVSAFIVDLDAGLLLSTTGSWNAKWSPDGQWVAFGQAEQVIITDQDGQERFALQMPLADKGCFDIAWNPVADLSGIDH